MSTRELQRMMSLVVAFAVAAAVVSIGGVSGCSGPGGGGGKGESGSPAGESGDGGDVGGEAGVETALVLYRRAQEQMKAGERNEGYATGKCAMAAYEAEGSSLAWLLLERFEIDGKRIDVHLNMSPIERRPPTNGIIRPLFFRIWSTDESERLIRQIYYEIGLMDGQPRTSAFAEQTERYRANLGMVDIDATYEEIREKLIRLVQ